MRKGNMGSELDKSGILSQRDIKEYTEEYLKAPFLKRNNEYRRRAVIRELKKYKHKRILEIGCGIFPLISYLGEQEYSQFTIVEPSGIFSANAEKAIIEHGLQDKVKIINDYFENIKITEEYDYIICSSLLHEVLSPYDFLKLLRKACSFDTVVHINVPNAFSIHRLIAEYGGGY